MRLASLVPGSPPLPRDDSRAVALDEPVEFDDAIGMLERRHESAARIGSAAMSSLPYLVIGWLLVTSFALACAAQAAMPAAPSGMLTLAPKPAPALQLSNADGKSFDLKQARGHWTLVHFWASWCGPCRKEMPTLQAMASKLPALKLVLVNTAETEDEVFSFLATVSPDLDSLLDRDGSVTERWRPRGLPSSFIVDRKGQLRYLALGGRDWTSPAYFNFLAALVKQP